MSGAIRVPVWPTWSVWLRQPLLVTAREQPDDAAEQVGELLQRREAVGRADAATAADDHRRGRQRDPGGPLDTVADDGAGQRRIELRLERARLRPHRRLGRPPSTA